MALSFRNLHTPRDLFRLPVSLNTVTGVPSSPPARPSPPSSIPPSGSLVLLSLSRMNVCGFFVIIQQSTLTRVLQISPPPFRIRSQWSTGGCTSSTHRRKGCSTALAEYGTGQAGDDCVAANYPALLGDSTPTTQPAGRRSTRKSHIWDCDREPIG